MDTVTHHGRMTAYEYVNQSETESPGVLCVHASGSSHSQWTHQFTLADSRPIVALDLSGHGESDDVDADPGYETLEAYADDVVAVAEKTDCSVLVGCSLGGAVVLWTALWRNLDLDAVVLTATGAKLAVLDDLLVWLGEDFDRAVEFLHQPDRLFHDADAETIADSKARFYAAGQAVTERDFRTCHTFDVRGRLDGIEIPTVAIAGEYDKLTPPWYHEYLAGELPNCSLVRIQKAAHLTMLEQPTAFNNVLSAFLDRHCED